MNDVLAQVMDDFTPRFNAEVMNGLATNSLKTAPEYLDAIIRSSMRSATPKTTLHLDLKN